MVEHEDVVALRADEDFQRNLERIDGTPHVRFPLVNGSLDDFEGVVYAATILHNLDALQSGEKTFQDVATPPMTVAPETPISTFIDQCQAQNQELALVEADDQVIGLLTATDAFEEITGELEDPMDRSVTGSGVRTN